MQDRKGEILLLVGLIVIVLVFSLVLLPLGIEKGFGSPGPGLSPRAMPQLASTGIALALAYGLLLALLGNQRTSEEPESPGPPGAHPLRAIGAVFICLAFAHLGFALFGFYLGGVGMAMFLTLLLGERQLFRVVIIPVLILALIYGIFELGFQIHLPKADFIPGLPI